MGDSAAGSQRERDSGSADDAAGQGEQDGVVPLLRADRPTAAWIRLLLQVADEAYYHGQERLRRAALATISHRA